MRLLFDYLFWYLLKNINDIDCYKLQTTSKIIGLGTECLLLDALPNHLLPINAHLL